MLKGTSIKKQRCPFSRADGTQSVNKSQGRVGENDIILAILMWGGKGLSISPNSFRWTRTTLERHEWGL
jgi:hypothetical protein